MADIDKYDFEHALTELFTNSVEAMQEQEPHRHREKGHKITISVSLADSPMSEEQYDKPHFVVVDFSDTGLGIRQSDKKRLFEPFETTKKTGTGLGLPIVREIVEAHGGTVVETGEWGLGARFLLHFPITAGNA